MVMYSNERFLCRYHISSTAKGVERIQLELSALRTKRYTLNNARALFPHRLYVFSSIGVKLRLSLYHATHINRMLFPNRPQNGKSILRSALRAVIMVYETIPLSSEHNVQVVGSM